MASLRKILTRPRIFALLLTAAFLTTQLAVVGVSGARSMHPAPPPLPSPRIVVLQNISVGAQPTQPTYDRVNHQIYVANYGSGTVSIIRSSTNKVIHNLTVGTHPDRIDFDAATNSLYVLNLGSNSVSVISGVTDKIVQTLHVPATLTPASIYDPANGNVYVISEVSPPSQFVVTEINATTYSLTTIAIGPASSIAYDPASQEVLTANTLTNNLSALSPNSTRATTIPLPSGLGPVTMTYDPFNHEMYVSDSGFSTHGPPGPTGNVSVLSKNNSIVRTIVVGQLPILSTYNPSNHEMYVVNEGFASVSTTPNSTVSVLSAANSVVKTIKLGKGGILATFDPKNDEMYVACALANKTYVINSTTNRVVAKLTTLDNPYGTMFDPANSDLLVIPYGGVGTTLITVISPADTIVTTLSLGSGLPGVAFDPTNRDVYVSNLASGTVSVLR
ncbi:MAG: YncE family protein [Thermoplasmata archaeon]|nr:YncE family protein [Thermoplasmata archaeon]